MELGFLVLVIASGAGGVVCRRWLGTAVGRYLMLLGITALGLGLLILGLTVLGTGLVGTWTAGLGSALLLLLAAAVLPFAAALVTGRK